MADVLNEHQIPYCLIEAPSYGLFPHLLYIAEIIFVGISFSGSVVHLDGVRNILTFRDTAIA